MRGHGWLLAILLGCSAAEQPASLTQPILGGAPDPDLTGVAHLSHPDSPVVCSAAAMSTSIVITAAHCASDLSIEGFEVGFGPDVDHLTLRSAATVSIGASDVALIELTAPVPYGTRVLRPDLDYWPEAGHELTLAGFGLSSITTGEAGVLLSTTDAVTAFDPDAGIIETTGQGASEGDSGGPALFESMLIGVISTVGDPGKTYIDSVANPAVAALIADALPACEDEPEICENGQDDDCNGLVDDGCAPDGDPCTSEADCMSGICLGSICVRPCPDLNPCPLGTDCWDPGGEGICVEREVPGAAGSAPVVAADPPATGCGCRTHPARPSLWGLLLGLVAALRRR